MHDSNIKVPNSACAFREGVLELPPEGSVRDFQPRSGAGHSVWGERKIVPSHKEIATWYTVLAKEGGKRERYWVGSRRP